MFSAISCPPPGLPRWLTGLCTTRVASEIEIEVVQKPVSTGINPVAYLVWGLVAEPGSCGNTTTQTLVRCCKMSTRDSIPIRPCLTFRIWQSPKLFRKTGFSERAERTVVTTRIYDVTKILERRRLDIQIANRNSRKRQAFHQLRLLFENDI